ncbi:hypothetical protein ACRQ5B_08970 [Pseudarthrobacter sp. L19]|uniref:hypothetical protein n=1 Tax=Pseudarthrobacter sp. L19 TaxID=3423951 RepID=UPI003D7B9DCC
MKRTLAAIALAGTYTLLGALPAMAVDTAESTDPRGNSAVAGGDRTINVGTVGSRSAVAPVLSGFNDPATATGVLLWSAVGGVRFWWAPPLWCGYAGRHGPTRPSARRARRYDIINPMGRHWRKRRTVLGIPLPRRPHLPVIRRPRIPRLPLPPQILPYAALAVLAIVSTGVAYLALTGTS